MVKGAGQDKSVGRGELLPFQVGINWADYPHFYRKEIIWEPVPKQHPSSMLSVISGGLNVIFFNCEMK